MPASTVDYVDVLVVGAGPAGLMTAEWLAHMGVKTRIVDKRGTKVFNGQADGVALRTQEIFDSFDISERLLKEAARINKFNFWYPGQDGLIQRSGTMDMGRIGNYSHFANMVVLHQGRIERLLLDKIKDVSDIKVERGVMPSKLDIDESQVNETEAFPITVELQHLSSEEATPQQNLTSVPDGLFRSNLSPDDTDDLIQDNDNRQAYTETVKAKYMVGCDGAHSWTRRQLGLHLEGDATDYIWGVLDILPKTNFPDIRRGNAIHSANNGSILVIPRERGLVRLYVQLKEVQTERDGRADRAKIQPETILDAARRIMKPYTIEYDYCDWWTAYQVGQRCMKTYGKHNRVFLAGDACHTHSPKAGQGMNVSMQDAYNLGWKLGLVAKGLAKPEILSTYESERNWVGAGLIDVDRRISRAMSGKHEAAPPEGAKKEDDSESQDTAKIYQKSQTFQAGTEFVYDHSLLVASAPKDGVSQRPTEALSKPKLATGMTIGQRIRSHKVLNQADYLSWHFTQWFVSDGRFRILLFAGDVSKPQQKQRVANFCVKLEEKDSILCRYNSAAASSPRSLIQLLALHSANENEVDLDDFPATLRPLHEHRGYDYNTIFVDAKGDSGEVGLGEAYEKYGIDRGRGCVVVLRPDQHVGFIGEIEDVDEMGRYFAGILQPVDKQRGQLAFQEREKVLGAVSARNGNHADV